MGHHNKQINNNGHIYKHLDRRNASLRHYFPRQLGRSSRRARSLSDTHYRKQNYAINSCLTPCERTGDPYQDFKDLKRLVLILFIEAPVSKGLSAL